MKILLIEDEKAMSDLIALKFNIEGFTISQASSLAEARQKLTTEGPFDFILADYLLPDGDSTDLLDALKKNPLTAAVPIAIMTNYIEDVNVEKMKAIGVADVFAKYQVVPAQMVERVKKLLHG